jgi:hypothetical protein
MKCDRCGEGEVADIFPTAYDGDGNPLGEEALCEKCIFCDWEEEMLAIFEELDEDDLLYRYA